MDKRVLASAGMRLAVGVLAIGLAASPAGAASGTSRADRFERLSVAGMPTKLTPAAVDGSRRMNVIVQLAAKSVGQQQAQALRQGRSLTKAERAQARAELRRQQQPLVSRIEALGGKVYERYQDAYNGVAARVAVRDLPALESAPGVVAVHRVGISRINDVAGNQYIGGPLAWQSTGRTGAGVKIGIIDTGVDYTHAEFGGPGTQAAFDNNDRTVIEAGTFPTAKVVGGLDFVGDDYDASDPDHDVPQPDPDPLDCNGHGSHVAGIAAGQGVLDDGSTYTGPYDGTTFSHTFKVGPGVAPEARIYAYKVFGCEGSVEDSIVVAALDQALRDGVDVVNMSLGSPYGTPDAPEAEAIDTLSLAGVVVVAAAGNESQHAYTTGAPASADRAISVAALDASRATVPGAHAVFTSTDLTVDLQDSNEAPFDEGLTLPVVVLRDASGGISLGCDPAEYTAAHVEGALVVTKRGTCARVARAIYGQQAGAAAVVMLNTDAAYPPMEGTITSNPDTGEPFDVTIPFFGAPGTTQAAQALMAADGGQVTLTHTDIANPGYQRLASFTSGGPRNGDSGLKPDVTAPGVAVLSTGVGTGTEAATISGTSQATPMTAGAAALVTQAHPDWTTERIKAAIMNTADPSLDKSYNVRVSGAGVVQVQRAIDTQADILAGDGQSTLSYGAEQIGSAYSETLPMTIENTGSSPLTYDITSQFNGNPLGASITASPSSVTVPAGGTATVQVTLALSAAQVAALPSADTSNFGAIVTIRGTVLATPTTTGPGIYQLRVPFLVAPRGTSDVEASGASKSVPAKHAGSMKTTSVVVTNGGIHSGSADVYAWNISDPRDSDGYVDVRAAGVQAFPGTVVEASADDRFLVFAVNMHNAWSTPDAMEVDIPIDRNHDGEADAWVVGVDLGAVTAGDDNGQFVAFTLDAQFNIIDAWLATAPMNTSTMELPALASELGLSAAHPSFAYAVETFDRIGTATDATPTGVFDGWAPAVTTGAFAALDPGDSATLSLSFSRPDARTSRTKGWLIVTLDDPSGAAQAELVRLPH